MTNPFESCSLLCRHGEFVSESSIQQRRCPRSEDQNFQKKGSPSGAGPDQATQGRGPGSSECDSDMPRQSCHATTCRCL